MEPDILASAGDPTAVRRHWSDANTVQTEDLPTMEPPSDSSRPRLMRLQAVSAHAPAIPRARVHAGGFANGHARPRSAMPAHWPAATPASAPAVSGVLPFETPESEGVYLRAGQRIVDITAALIGLL